MSPAAGAAVKVIVVTVREARPVPTALTTPFCQIFILVVAVAGLSVGKRNATADASPLNAMILGLPSLIPSARANSLAPSVPATRAVPHKCFVVGLGAML